MKNFLLGLLIISSSSLALAARSYDVENWDNIIPTSEKALVDALQEKAYEDFYFEDDGTACGGVASRHVLQDYYTGSSYEGELYYELKIEFYVTSSFNYCQNEVLFRCIAPVRVASRGELDLAQWDCIPVETGELK